MVVGLLAMLFIIVAAYITLARYERATQTQIARYDKLERIVDSINEFAIGRLRDQLADGQGRLLAGGWSDSPRVGQLAPVVIPNLILHHSQTGRAVDSDYSAEDVPGFRGSRMIGGSEMIRDYTLETLAFGQPVLPLPGGPAYSWADVAMAHLLLPGASQGSLTLDTTAPPVPLSLAGGTPYAANSREVRFALEYDPGNLRAPRNDMTTPLSSLLLDRNGDKNLDYNDLLDAALAPYMDADGDGITDTFMPAMAVPNEIANAQAGTPVRAPDSVEFSHGNRFQFVNPADLDRIFSRNRELFDRFDLAAEFTTAIRVVSHGGMGLMAIAPLAANQSNSTAWISNAMLDWLRDPDDRWVGTLAPNEYVELANAGRDVAAVEPVLRRRGSMPSYREGRAGRPASTPPRTPQSLASWERYFPRSIAGVRFERRWDRYNLADATDFARFQLENFLQPATWNRKGLAAMPTTTQWPRIGQEFGDVNPADYDETAAADSFAAFRKTYDERHLLTTINNSDELARVQDPLPWPILTNDSSAVANAARLNREVARDNYLTREVQVAGPGNTPPQVIEQGPALGLYAGEAKLFLGEAELAFNPLTGAFDTARGAAVIRRFANYFYDMLSGHEFPAAPNRTTSPELDVNEPPTEDRFFRQIVSRREQALMLAVNTVAFAAPRVANGLAGWVDVVHYNDAGGRQYIGFGPQPYITNVIAVRKAGGLPTPGAPPSDEISLAIQLFNPNERTRPGTTIPYDLPLEQFKISFNDEHENALISNSSALHDIAAAPGPFGGRSFRTVTASDTAPNYFAPGSIPALVDPQFNPVAHDLPMPVSSLGGVSRTRGSGATGLTNVGLVIVKLWRRSANPANPTWYKVDQFEAELGEPPPDDGDPATDEIAIVRTGRNIESDTFFGVNPATPSAKARWRCVTGFRIRDEELERIPAMATGGGPSGADVETSLTPEIRRPFDTPDIPAATPGDRGPVVPLYTMNGGLGGTVEPINGAVRPISFPTVGFMLFVPRYSHVAFPNLLNPQQKDRIAMSEWMRAEWEYRNYKSDKWPADFGHMPIFDNKQKPEANGYFADSAAGTTPWGQLVFDYFTTRNVSNPVMATNALFSRYVYENPTQIAGRININTASWWVLAGLPMIHKNRATTAPFSPIPPLTNSSASPAFWSGSSGILFGQHGTLMGSLIWPGEAFTRRTDDSGMLLLPYRPPAAPPAQGTDVYRLGPTLGQAAAAYRDQVPYSPEAADLPGGTMPDNHPTGSLFAWTRDNAQYHTSNRAPLNGIAALTQQRLNMPAGTQAISLRIPRDAFDTLNPNTGGLQQIYPSPYNRKDSPAVRGARLYRFDPGSGTFTNEIPNSAKYGFVSVGELINVPGMAHDRDGYALARVRGALVGPGSGTANASEVYANTSTWPLNSNNPDFVKAISYLVLLDSHYVTTRSNTFTVYTSLMANEPQQQQRSLRSQVTVDRSNILPLPIYSDDDGDGNPNEPEDNDGLVRLVAVQQPSAKPQIIAERQTGYFNTQYDE